MRFFEVVVSGAALIAAAFAVEFNDVPTSLEAGKTYTITYSPKDSTATTIRLRQGVSTNLNVVDTLTTSATGGSFTWTVPNTLPNAENYAFDIKQGSGEINYSGQIPLTGSSATSSASSSASATSTSKASSSSGYSTVSLSSASSASPSSASASATKASSSILTLTTAASASGIPSPSSSSNGTISATRTPTTSSSGSSSTDGSSPPQNSSAVSMLASSPLVVILGALAAMAFLN